MSNSKKLILIGKDEKIISLAKNFAKKYNLDFASYTEKDWATLEEIDQYIQDEELSTQVLNLPAGQNEDVSLDSITKKHIEKVLYLKQLNINEVSKTLKISRATLYRKMEQNGLNRKNERKKLLKKYDQAA